MEKTHGKQITLLEMIKECEKEFQENVGEKVDKLTKIDIKYGSKKNS